MKAIKKIMIPILVLLAFYTRGTNLALNVSSVSGAQGNYVIVPVKVAHFSNILSMQGTLEFNSSVLSYHSIQNFSLPGLSASNFGVSQTSNGKLTFSWFDQDLSGESLADSTVLFAVKFYLAGSVGQNSAVSLTSSITQLEFTNTTFSVIPFTTLPGVVSITSAGTGTLKFKIDSVSGISGSQISVPVRVYSFNNMVSIQGTIEFDPAKISFVATEQYGLAGMNSSNFGVTQATNGKLTFSWFDNTLAGVSKANGSVIFALKFNLLGGAGTHSNVVMTNSVTPLEFVDNTMATLPYTLIPGNVNITNISSQTLTLFGDSVASAPSVQVVVPFRADNFRKIISMQGTLSFNTSVITYVGVEQFGLPGMSSSSFGTTQTGTGNLTFSWYDQTLTGQTVADSSVLFAVRYNVVGSIGQHSDISFINSPTPVEVIDTSYNPVNTTLYRGHVEVLNLIGVSVNSISNDTLCAGDSIQIPYTKWGTFNAGNVFTAQLSNSSGSFASPVNIGSITSSSNGVIHGLIPANTIQGTQYKIRIIASNPAVTGSPFSGSLSVFSYPVADAGNDISVCTGGSVNLTATGGGSYHWSTNANTSAIIVTPVNTTKYYVTVTNSGGCSSRDSVTVTVYPLPNGQVTQDTTICIGSSVTLIASGGTSYHWSNNVNSANNNVSPLVNTQYMVTITDINSCNDVDTVNVYVTTVIAEAGTNQISCAGSSVVLNASGGNTYHWSNGINAAINNVSPTTTTTYYVTVTGPNSCTGIDSVKVTVNALPLANATNDTSICIGNSITLTATGGTQYQWSNGPSTQQNLVSPVVQTKYIVTVTDANNCSAKDSVTVSVYALPTITLNNDTAICIGNVLNLIAGGGVNYAWSNNIYTAANPVSPLTTTTYFVTVTDIHGCSKSDNVLVTVNNVTADAGQNDTICKGETVLLNATGGVSYHWSSGQNTQSVSVNPIISTSFYVTVTTAQNCSATDSVKIYVNQLPLASAGSNVAICIGNNTVLTATGGIQYAWDNGINAAVNNVSPLVSTQYIVTVTDVNNCVNSDTVLVTVHALPVATISNDTAICMNQPVTLIAGGGVSYLWSNNSTSNSITLTPSSSGSYFVTVTDINGCADTADVYITINNATADAGMNVSICTGDTAVLDATGGVSYHWNTGANSQSIQVNPLSQSTYYVTITSAQGCIANDSVIVFVHQLPAADAGNNVSVCFGNQAFLLASGGISYAWNNGINTQNNIVNPTSTTTYYVTITDANNCSASDSVRVTVNALPSAVTSNDTSVCRFQTVTLSAYGGNSYSWSNGAGSQSTNVSPLVTTTFFVTVTDINGCTDTSSVLVTILNTNASAGNDTNICAGNSVILTATGGTLYAWNTGNTTSAITVSPALDSTYIVTITNANNCVASDSVTVFVHQIPIAEAGNDTAVCKGNFAFLHATGGDNYYWNIGGYGQSINVSADSTTTYYVTVSDAYGCSSFDSVKVVFNPLPVILAGSDTSICSGTFANIIANGGLSYYWNIGSSSQSISVNPTQNTDYIVTGTDNNNCSNRDTVTVFVNTVNAFAGSDTNICVGNSVNLTANGGVLYAWSTGENSSTIIVSPIADSTYIVTVTSVENCVASDSVRVFVHQVPVAEAGNDTAVCIGNLAFLNASGGTYYQWNIGVNNQSVSVTADSTTTYFVTVSDAYGCSSFDSVKVVVNQLPVIFAGNDTTVCSGSNVILSVTGGISYSWSTGDITATIIVNPTAQTEYVVTGLDINSCSNKDTIVVSVNSINAFAGNDTSICYGNGVILTASGGIQYVWSNGVTTSSNNVNPIITTTYSVVVTDLNNCSDSDSVLVTVNSLPLVNLGADTIHSNLPVTLDAGAGFSAYQWTGGFSSQTISANSYGWYFVTVTDGNTCSAGDSVYVDVFVNVENIKNNLIQVYPNPVKEILFIENINVPAQINLYDITGKIIINRNADAGLNHIDISSLSPGCYSVVIKVEKMTYVKQIIKQ